METRIEPVVKRTEVECSLEHAFRTFTDGLDTWWPLHTHSVAAFASEGRRRAVSAGFEPRLGGRLYETMDDGSEGFWAEVIAWEPPHRLVLAWSPGAPEETPTEIEVRFSEGGGKTIVELEHRGWERLGERAQEARDDYANGWPTVWGHFVEKLQQA